GASATRSLLLAALVVGELAGDRHPEVYTAVAASPVGAAALVRRNEVAPLIATPGANPEIEKRVGRWWLLVGKLPAGAVQPILARWGQVIGAEAVAAWQRGAGGGQEEELG